MALMLASNDAENSALTLGVVMSHRVRQSARPTEHALAAAALNTLRIGKTPTASPWNEPAYHLAIDPADLGGMPRGRMVPQGGRLRRIASAKYVDSPSLI